MSECIFCRILDGTCAATFIHRDERVAAFMDIQPVNPGHLLVIPTHHAEGLADLDPETGGELFRTAQRMAQALRQSGLRCEGVSLSLADGKAAMQEVPHVHLHVIPRFAGDGFGFQFSERDIARPDRAELDEAAERIRRAIDASRGPQER